MNQKHKITRGDAGLVRGLHIRALRVARIAQFCRSMRSALAITIDLLSAGCGPPRPVPKAKHVQQIQQLVAAVGVTNIISESRTLFTRLSHETNVSAVPAYMAGSDKQ